MTSISVSKLTKRRGTAEVLSGVDLTVEPGEMFFLLGPRNAGKSALIRCLAGFDFPDKGTIRFDNEDVTAVPAHKRNTGVMSKGFTPWAHMTVAQNVGFGLEERRLPRDEIARTVTEVLEVVGMAGRGKERPADLSDVEQQRVVFARVLAIRPRCLLLDEPLAHLDAPVRGPLRTEIRRICKERKLTAIYVTHDRREVLSIADRAAVLKDGRILQVGSPREIYRRPFDSDVAAIVAATNLVPGVVESTSGVRTIVGTDLGTFVGVLTRAGKPPAPGKKAMLSIRPETLQIDGEVVGSQNTFVGTVTEALYHGDTAEYHFEANGTVIKAAAFNPRQLLSRGKSDVTVSVDPEDVAVMVE